jgi:predicted Zn-ribbon and HTH transcriptional regulator
MSQKTLKSLETISGSLSKSIETLKECQRRSQETLGIIPGTCKTCQYMITNGIDEYMDSCRWGLDLNEGEKGNCTHYNS